MAWQASLMKAIAGALMAAGCGRLEDMVTDPEHPGARVFRQGKAGLLPDDPREWFERERRAASGDYAAMLERAERLVAAARLGPDDVAELLSAANAPGPVSRDGLVELAAECLQPAMDHQYDLGSMDWSARKIGWAGARAAQATLVELLPSIIDELDYIGDPTDRRGPQFRAALAAIEALDLRERNIGPGRRPWAQHVTSLAKTYTETVDPEAGWSRDGPAVRFIEGVLARAYPQGNIARAAIETELGRSRRR
jgi:hypothetical protein